MTSDIAEVVALRIKKQFVNEIFRGIKVRCVTRTKLAVDCLKRVFFAVDAVLLDRVRDDGTFGRLFGFQEADLLHFRLLDLFDHLLAERRIFVDDDFARFSVDDISADDATEILFQVDVGELHFFNEAE